MQYGYIRVSSRDQHYDRQLKALTDAGVDITHIATDLCSGKNFERPAYKRLVKKLKPGDTLVIKSIDRLGRNYEDLLEQWRFLTRKKQVSIVVLDMPLLDTCHERDLTGTLIADIVLQLLSYVAQTEREFIRQRQREGIDAAKERGVKFGRRPLEIPKEFFIYKEQWKNGEITSRLAAEKLHVSQPTFIRWVKKID